MRRRLHKAHEFLKARRLSGGIRRRVGFFAGLAFVWGFNPLRGAGAGEPIRRRHAAGEGVKESPPDTGAIPKEKNRRHSEFSAWLTLVLERCRAENIRNLPRQRAPTPLFPERRPREACSMPISGCHDLPLATFNLPSRVFRHGCRRAECPERRRGGFFHTLWSDATSINALFGFFGGAVVVFSEGVCGGEGLTTGVVRHACRHRVTARGVFGLGGIVSHARSLGTTQRRRGAVAVCFEGCCESMCWPVDPASHACRRGSGSTRG